MLCEALGISASPDKRCLMLHVAEQSMSVLFYVQVVEVSYVCVSKARKVLFIFAIFMRRVSGPIEDLPVLGLLQVRLPGKAAPFPSRFLVVSLQVHFVTGEPQAAEGSSAASEEGTQQSGLMLSMLSGSVRLLYLQRSCSYCTSRFSFATALLNGL